VREEISKLDSEIFVSAITIWEAAIKAALGRLRADGSTIDAVAEHKFLPLDVTMSHAAAAGALPLHHRDPFDRMLVAQAQLEGLVLVSHDRRLAPYDIPILWT